MNTFELGILVRKALLEPEQKAFQAEVESLIRRNSECYKETHQNFMFDGVIYKLATTKGASAGAPSLDLSLLKQMQEATNVLKQCKREVQTVWQAMLPLVETHGPANGLPDSLKSVLSEQFGPRTLAFDALIPLQDETIRKNWLSAQKLLAYFTSLRLVL